MHISKTETCKQKSLTYFRKETIISADFQINISAPLKCSLNDFKKAGCSDLFTWKHLKVEFKLHTTKYFLKLSVKFVIYILLIFSNINLIAWISNRTKIAFGSNALMAQDLGNTLLLTKFLFHVTFFINSPNIYSTFIF